MRVATFNLKHGALPEGYRGHPEKVADACAELEADILALQEVDCYSPRSGLANLAALAAEAAGMEPVFRPTRSRLGLAYGNALLVRGEIKQVTELDLGGTTRFRKVAGLPFAFGFERRNAILAKATVEGKDISVAATHLSTRAPELNGRQLEQVIAALAVRPAPQVLLGDLNRLPADVIPYTKPFHFELTPRVKTYPSRSPRAQIDHIAVSGLKIISAEAREMPISDHRALIAEVEFE